MPSKAQGEPSAHPSSLCMCRSVEQTQDVAPLVSHKCCECRAELAALAVRKDGSGGRSSGYRSYGVWLSHMFKRMVSDVSELPTRNGCSSGIEQVPQKCIVGRMPRGGRRGRGGREEGEEGGKQREPKGPSPPRPGPWALGLCSSGGLGGLPWGFRGFPLCFSPVALPPLLSLFAFPTLLCHFASVGARLRPPSLRKSSCT